MSVEYVKIEICGSKVYYSSHNGANPLALKEKKIDAFASLVRELKKEIKNGATDVEIIEDSAVIEKRRSDNIKRTRDKIIKISECNMTKLAKFVTLTYKREETSLDTAKKDLKRFIRNMQRQGMKCGYIAIPEIQEERFKKYGAKVWHWHVILFTNKFVDWKTVRSCWGQGNIDIKAITNKGVASYVAKYVTKQKIDEIKGQFYIISKNLKKPRIYKRINDYASRRNYIEKLKDKIKCFNYRSYCVIDNCLNILCEGEIGVFDAESFFSFYGGFKNTVSRFTRLKES